MALLRDQQELVELYLQVEILHTRYGMNSKVTEKGTQVQIYEGSVIPAPP